MGGGPGDPGLLTVRGRELLERADVVVYDALVSPRLLDGLRPDVECIYVGKRAARHAMPQDGINALLVERAQRGQTVVRLKGGDPFLFGRGGEEALALGAAGVPFEVVPGVTAGVAVPAYAGIPVTHRELASAVGFVTGHEADEKDASALDWSALARWPGTLVFFMGLGNLPHICENLVRHGLDPQTPAAAIRRGTTPSQRSVTGTVEDLPAAVAEVGLRPPALILVGQVAALRDRLNWFERRPLFGRRVVVTRARRQASALSARLEELGAEVAEVPTIRIATPEDPEPLARAVREAGGYDWIVFTSTNAVDAFFDALAAEKRDARSLGACRLCAVGPATAERLSARGLLADAMPEVYRGNAVADALASAGDLDGSRVLLPRADIAPGDLPETLAARGARVTEVVAYRTVAECPDAEVLGEQLARREIRWLTFTSSSTVRNLVAVIEPGAIIQSGPLIASIGPSTSKTLREFGLQPTVEADPHTVEALVDALVGFEICEGKNG